MAEDQVREEEKFEFTPAGEAFGYISLDQAQVLAMRTARATPGSYGIRFRNAVMAFEVVEANDTEDHYVITISVRPEGEFAGRPGREQFFIEKEGTIALRQVLSLPGVAVWRRYRLSLIGISLVIVMAAVVDGVFVVASGVSNDSTPVVATLPTSTPESPAPTPVPTLTAETTAVPAVIATATPMPAAVPSTSKRIGYRGIQ